MDVLEVTRAANVILGAVLMYACCMRLARDWPRWTRRERLVRVHLVGYLIVTSAGSALLLADGPPEVRASALLLVNLSFAAALWRSRKDPVH